MTFWEMVYRIADSIFCMCGIFLNAILIYCIQNKSPKSIATYSFLLINCAIADLLTCAVTLFVQPRIMVNGENFYYIAHGYCSIFGAAACFYGYGVMITLYGHLTVSQLASFVYRWYILHWPVPSKQVMAVVIFLTMTPTLFAFFGGALPFILETCCNSFKEEIVQMHPELDVDAYTTFGVPNAMSDFRAAVPTAWVWLPVFPITIAVFRIRSRILHFLDQHANFSQQTKRMHQSLLKALTLQALLPPIHMLGMCIFTIDWFFQTHHPILEYGFFFLCGWVPILAPLFPLYFVTPYRNYLISLFIKETNNIGPLGSNQNNTSSSQRSIIIHY